MEHRCLWIKGNMLASANQRQLLYILDRLILSLRECNNLLEDKIMN